MAFSGEEMGVLEPCGCSPAMLGGLARRPARLAASKEAGVPMVYVVGGGLTAGRSDYDQMRARSMLRALAAMGCDAFAPTPAEVADGLVAAAMQAAVLPVIDMGGSTDGAVLANLPPGGDRAFAVSWSSSDPKASLASRRRRSIPSTDAPLVVLSDADEATARGLAKELGGPVLVLYAAGGTDPRDADAVNGAAALAPYPAKGKYVGFAHLHGEGAAATWTVEYRPVVRELPEDERILQLKREHLDELRSGGFVAKGATDARFLVGPAPPADDRFVGNEACASCHADAFKTWKTSRHGDAMTSLRKTGDDADPGCVRCHVVAYGTGRAFLDDLKTPQFASVGCEQCHGPRGFHVEERRAGRIDARRPPVGEKGCLSCHDGEHDPQFAFGTRWPKIAHGVK